MSFLKKGPELKLPKEVKVPDFLLDLYYDLRERHLLPLVAVLAIGIVAVPIALSDSAGPDPGAIATPSAVLPGATDLVVAKAAPGLRDYRRRLEGRVARDPFVQQYSKEEIDAGGGAAAPAESTGFVPGDESSVSIEATSTPSGSTTDVTVDSLAGGKTTADVETKTKFAADTVDVRIVAVDSGEEPEASKAEPTVHRKVRELTMLPNRDTPVAIFMGASSDGKKALLLVSSDVQSVFGDGRCVVGSQVCQLLALEEGLPQTFVYGPQGRTFRIEILKIERTLSDKPDRASLGETEKQKQP